MAAVFQCAQCGAPLNPSEDMKVCRCDYCGVMQTLPKFGDEMKLGLFERAQKLRFINDFDAAANIFQQIVSLYPDEAEAYWGICLCKYGVEYVDDPATGKKMPTCHRSSYTSILDDDNYKSVIANSSSEALDIYRQQAHEIDRLNNAILNIARNEKPYDVFICYKETDSFGERTKDSLRAQEVYDALTGAGYKVFFARITLEDKLGQEYEPYIFAALNSAKIMLAIGSSAENFNAVWVKNEWSRFIGLMKQDHSKRLYPCYCDMNAYDLPPEFKNLQGQDMGRIGFEQDLIRNIKKIIPLEKDTVTESVYMPKATIEELKERGNDLLDLGNYRKAVSVFEQASTVYPKSHVGWWGLILANTENLTRYINANSDDEAVDTQEYNQLTEWYDYVKKTAPPDELNGIEAKLCEYCRVLGKYNETRQKSLYERRIGVGERLVEKLTEEKNKEVGRLEDERTGLNNRIYEEKTNCSQYESRARSANKKMWLKRITCFSSIILFGAVFYMAGSGFHGPDIGTFMVICLISAIVMALLNRIFAITFGKTFYVKSDIRANRDSALECRSEIKRLSDSAKKLDEAIEQKEKEYSAKITEINSHIKTMSLVKELPDGALADPCAAICANGFGIKYAENSKDSDSSSLIKSAFESYKIIDELSKKRAASMPPVTVE